jgi:hypothetical protein
VVSILRRAKTGHSVLPGSRNRDQNHKDELVGVVPCFAFAATLVLLGSGRISWTSRACKGIPGVLRSWCLLGLQ